LTTEERDGKVSSVDRRGEGKVDYRRERREGGLPKREKGRCMEVDCIRELLALCIPQKALFKVKQQQLLDSIQG
jgi:hypothetical protein